jgi:hypothetical protein
MGTASLGYAAWPKSLPKSPFANPRPTGPGIHMTTAVAVIIYGVLGMMSRISCWCDRWPPEVNALRQKRVNRRWDYSEARRLMGYALLAVRGRVAPASFSLKAATKDLGADRACP